MKKIKSAIYSLAAGLSLLGAQAMAQSLPNGASSINEQYGQWAVNCSLQNNAKLCMVSQQRFNTNNQPVISINLQDQGNGAMTAVVILPFGILVSKPVVFQLDDSKNVADANVRTCLPQGCVVSLAFDKAMIGAMQKSKLLNVVPRSAGGDEEEVKNLNFDMDGFTAALERLRSLSK